MNPALLPKESAVGTIFFRHDSPGMSLLESGFHQFKILLLKAVIFSQMDARI
jgi:hypothetical protein